MKTPGSINATVIVLVAFSTLLQCVALVGVLPLAAGSLGRHIFSSLEMLLVVLLLVQGWRIRQWSLVTGQAALVQTIARLCFYSLLMCVLGDFVNRNYFEQYYQWDSVIKHSYLIVAILFFFPAYSLVAIANWQLGREHVSRRSVAVSIIVALVLGTLAFLSSYDPRVNNYASSAIFVYTLLHAVLLVSSTWVVKAYGWPASVIVVIGVWLAAVADALIGNFWVYGDYFPQIEHANWIIYFASLAMIQQMPFLAAKGTRKQSPERNPAVSPANPGSQM